MKTGTANLPLYRGAAPRWLFRRRTVRGRLVRLAREIATIMVDEYGSQGFLQRLADPFWFQAFGCVLGFDWHSSGLTTTTCRALKVALAEMNHELGLLVAAASEASRRTPQKIESQAADLTISPSTLVYASEMSAKVDHAAVQDGYQLYHHVLVLDRSRHWAVIQQGMHQDHRCARFRDPARCSFAHGGKDGASYPVDRSNSYRTIELLRRAVGRAEIENSGRRDALKRLTAFEEESVDYATH